MKHLVLLLVCAVWVGSASAEVITIFDANDTITSADTYDTVVVKGDGTVVTMTGGSLNKLITMDDSTFNMTGVGLSYSIAQAHCYSYDTSTLNLSSDMVSSGSVPPIHIFALGNSRINYSDNFHWPSNCQHYFYDSSRVTFLDNANFEGPLHFKDNSSANITGGKIFDVRVEGPGNISVIISGGAIKNVAVPYDGGNAEIGILGYGLDKKLYGGTGTGEVIGFWNDDTPFQINLNASGTYPHVVLYDGTLPPDPLPSLQAQITALQQANVLLVQRNALLLQKVEENRYLMEQLPQLQKKLDELQAAVEEEAQPEEAP